DPISLQPQLIGDSAGGAVYANGLESQWIGCTFRYNSVGVLGTVAIVGGSVGGQGRGGAVCQSSGSAFFSQGLWASNRVAGGNAAGRGSSGSATAGDGIGGAIWNGAWLAAWDCQ